MRTLLLALIALSLLACNKPAEQAAPPVAVAATPPAESSVAEPEELIGNAALAERAIPQFHMAINDARFDDIYNSAAPELKQRKSQQEFVAQMRAMRDKLGEVSGTNRLNWRIEEQFPSSLVTLTFQSAYATGQATEEFVFRVQNDVANLAGYSVQSTVLTSK